MSHSHPGRAEGPERGGPDGPALEIDSGRDAAEEGREPGLPGDAFDGRIPPAERPGGPAGAVLEGAARPPERPGGPSISASEPAFEQEERREGGGPITLEDLLAMDRHGLHRVMREGHPVDREALAETQYLGVDLSLPGWARALLWWTFRKTFHRDGQTGALRGWNVKLEQRGLEGRGVPKRDRRGRAVTFGHYQLRDAAGIAFPWRWRGADFLDYGAVPDAFFDLARLGFTPLVAVNAGSNRLLLGWEVFRLGPLFLPLPLYWALRLEGPLEEVVPPVGG